MSFADYVETHLPIRGNHTRLEERSQEIETNSRMNPSTANYNKDKLNVYKVYAFFFQDISMYC